MQSNLDIRSAAMKAGVPHWRIAEEMGMRESDFSRLLRHELQAEEKEKIYKAIEILNGRR